MSSTEVWKSNKLPTIWRDGKAEVGRVREEKKILKEVRRSEKRKSDKREDAGARKGRKVTIHCVFPLICGSGGSKSNLAKAAGAEPSGQMRDKKLHVVVARSTCPSQNVQNKTHQLRTTFGSWDVEKVHCVVARSSKCTQHTNLGPLLEVELSQQCTPLWREAHFQVKMHKAPHPRTTFGSWDVEKVHAVVARTIPSQKWQKLKGSDHFLTLGCPNSVQVQLQQLQQLQQRQQL